MEDELLAKFIRRYPEVEIEITGPPESVEDYIRKFENAFWAYDPQVVSAEGGRAVVRRTRNAVHTVR